MDASEFKAFVSMLKGLYPKAESWDNEIQLRVWYDLAKDIPLDLSLEFLSMYVRNNKFPPTLADYNEFCVNKIVPELKDAMTAWGEVQDAVHKLGYMREVEALESFDELTRSVVRDIGFKEFCMTEEDNLPVLRAQFRNAYEARQKKAEHKRMTIGIRETLGIEGGVMDGN